MPHRLTFRSLLAGSHSYLKARSALNVTNPPTVVGLSDIGRARARNEDSIHLLPDLGVAVVADGMGGHPGGDVASRLAARTAAGVLAEAVAMPSPVEASPDHLRTAMARSVAMAHEAIRARGVEEPGLVGMGTTLTAMVVDHEKGRYVVGHVGDSRAYRYRDGTLTQLTRDDTWVQERIDARQLTREQAKSHPFGHLLTQCVGLDSAPVPLLLDGAVTGGETYLICTDGLVGMLDDRELERILGKYLDAAGTPEDPDAPLRELVAAANAAGGHDNITAALVRIA